MTNKIKRFYSAVVVIADDKGFTVELDGRPVSSPGKRVLSCPNEVFAENIAEEWRRQGDYIDLANMPNMHFASVITDTVLSDPDEAREEIQKYAHSDLLCYRAEGPDALVERQKNVWDGVLERFKREEQVDLLVTGGIQYVEQSAHAMKRFGALVAALEGYQLAAVHFVTCLSGSAVLAMALHKHWLSPDAVWELCHVDEDFQIEQWGCDSDEQKRRQRRYTEFCAASSVFQKASSAI